MDLAPPALQNQDEVKARILGEAERLFRHFGYSKTTMADIAEACNMSPANLYRFFQSKSALIEGICEVIVTESEKRLLKIINNEKSASERLELFAQDIHDFTLENLLDHRTVHEMVLVAMEESWCPIEEHLHRVCKMIERLIAEGVKSGEFRQVDPERMSRTVHAALVSIGHPVIVAQKMSDETRATPAEIIGLLFHGLKAKI